MPHSRNAKKRLRQNLKLRASNRAVKASLKTYGRRVREAVAAGQVETAEKEFRDLTSKLDRAATKRIIHPNAAARTKSRLSHLIKVKKQAGKPAATAS